MATCLCSNTLVLVLFIISVHWVYCQDVQWPLHTVCNSDTLTVSYRSCDILQDVGFTFLPCPNKLTDPANLRLALLLRQPIDELYLSAVLLLGGIEVFRRNEALCPPHFPRFTFCGSRRGELITIDSKLNSITELPLNGDFTFRVTVVNQDNFQIACVNATLSIM
ncbi:lymphocyte antigen 86 [Misgurnus anguillicaudatus]|uniref:lymphocyte antigen 86 n=1 Tax=Misgurnus anguillicaudatus TaxID=75329 RepID=UPI003CCF66FA